MKFCGNLHGGLNKLAETLEVKRLGPQHQARKMLLSDLSLAIEEVCVYPVTSIVSCSLLNTDHWNDAKARYS